MDTAFFLVVVCLYFQLMPEFDAQESIEAWSDEGDEDEQQHSSGDGEEEQCIFWIC